MKQGFTLIELLVVVMIIGVLSAIALPQYSTAIEKSRAAEALTILGATGQALERYYYSHNDSFPSDDSWSDLDIDVSSTGKYFTYNFDCGSSVCVVYATRSLTASAGKYYIKSILTDNGATITTSRCCTTSDTHDSTACSTAPTAGSKGETFCNAITGGHNVDGQF